jgi:hypothetical protein
VRGAFADAGCSMDVIDAILDWVKAYRRAFGIRDNQRVSNVPKLFNTNVIFPLNTN